MLTWNTSICLTLLVLSLSIAGVGADDANPATWLNAEGKDGRWKSVTERLRVNLQELKLTVAQEERWGPVLRDHCDKIQNRVNMEHMYSELYCDQVAMMVADLNAKRAPLGALSGKCVPFMYWSDYLQCGQGVRLVVPPEYDPDKEYQFFMKVRGLCGDLRYYLTNPVVHHYGAYDWMHIKFDIPLADPTRSTPTCRQESLALALARPEFKGGSARANSKVLLRCAQGTPCTASFAALAQNLPVVLQTRAKRFSIQGSCNQARDLKLVPPGQGKAGEVVIVQVTLENRGDTDLEGLSILAPRQNTGPRRNSWPSSNDLKLHAERPGMWGLYTIAGHHQRPHQQGGTFLLGTTRLDYHKHLLVIPGTGYAMGLVGIKQPLTLKAGKTENLFVLFLAANVDNPKEPVDFDFLAVALALKDQLDAETGRLALQPE